MRTIISEDQFKPFEPQTGEAMNEAFKAAWDPIETSGVELDDHVDLVRERIALRISRGRKVESETRSRSATTPSRFR